KRKKRTKASTLVAALNIKGIGNPNPWHPKHKRYHVNQLLKDNKVGVLVVGEGHINAARQSNIQNLFGRRLELIFSEDPISPNAKGLAFVVNKDLLNTDNMQTWEIVPGWAMLLQLHTHKNKTLVVLGVYAPNAPTENAAFWKSLREFFEKSTTPKPDIMAGDTNIVAEAIYRLPSHTDLEAATTELDLLLTSLRLVDGWRKTYPNTRAYTYTLTRHAGGGSQSRIDWIYVRSDKYAQTYDWRIQTVGISTDHRMVSARITEEGAPTTGPGRWVWPAHITKDKVLTEFIHERGMAIQDAAHRAANWPVRDPTLNVQTMWANFKAEIGDLARARAKTLIPKAAKEIEKLENDLEAINNDLTLSEEECLLSSALLSEKLAKTTYKNTTRVECQSRCETDLRAK
ncbi:Endonuclease/exonuclease/phosphatase, partial [Mycena leptocephala]